MLFRLNPDPLTPAHGHVACVEFSIWYWYFPDQRRLCFPRSPRGNGSCTCSSKPTPPTLMGENSRRRSPCCTSQDSSKDGKSAMICLVRILPEPVFAVILRSSHSHLRRGNRYASGLLKVGPCCKVRKQKGCSVHTLLRCMSRSRWERSDRRTGIEK